MGFWELRERILDMSWNNKIALGLRIFCLCVGCLLIIQGHPPAISQSTPITIPTTVEDESQDIKLTQMQEWHIEQAGTNALHESQIHELQTQFNDLRSSVSTLQGEVTGGIGLMTILTGLAVFFQLKRKAS